MAEFLNAARCLNCGDVIVSRYRHEYLQCECGAIAVDGGTDYIKRSGEAGCWVDLRTEEELSAALEEQARQKKEAQSPEEEDDNG